ncbi:MAG: GNAT family N-acetyltransferase [Bacteroidetes bacterium]|nr:GNAT family N-acetyltransferase [Bacteroidota bacterium]
MIYTRFGVSFHILKENDLEMVRQWRNDPVVANNYEFREYITPEMQQTWFRTVNNINNLYTVIEYRNEKIGVINIKNIDWDKRECEGGIFLPDPKHHNTGLPAIISYITTEIIFVIFDWNRGFAHVLKENKSVQQFVKMLGYELAPGQEDINNQKWTITRESFEKKTRKLSKAISVMVNTSDPGILLIEKSEYEDSLILQWESIVSQSCHIIKTEVTEKGRVYWFE